MIEKKKYILCHCIALTFFMLYSIFFCRPLNVHAADTKDITVQKGAVVTKSFDGTADATNAVVNGSYLLVGVESTDDVALAFTKATYNDISPAGANTVILSGLSLKGSDAGKYSLASSSVTLDGSISKHVLTSADNLTWKVSDSWPYSGNEPILGPKISPAGIAVLGIYDNGLEPSYEIYNSAGSKVSSTRMKDAGIYKVKFTGIHSSYDDYGWSDYYDASGLVGYTKEFTIIGTELKDSMIKDFPERLPQKPALNRPTFSIVNDVGTTLSSSEYSATYSNNGSRAGTLTVTITGRKQYVGTVTKNCEIYYEQYTGADFMPSTDHEFYTQGFTLIRPTGVEFFGDSPDSTTRDYEVTQDGVNIKKDIYIEIRQKIYTASFTYSMDSVMPEVTLENPDPDDNYYVDQLLNIKEDNLSKVVQTVYWVDSDYKQRVLEESELKPDENGNYYLTVNPALTAPSQATSARLYYDIVATDKAGLYNYSLGNMQLGVNVYPISRTYDKVTSNGSITEANALPTNKSNLEFGLSEYNNLLNSSPHASEAQKEMINKNIEKLQAMVDKINEVAQALLDIDTYYKNTDMNTVTSEHLQALKDIYDKAKELLDGQNLTTTEKEDLSITFNTIKTGYEDLSALNQKMNDLNKTFTSLSETSITKDDKEKLAQLTSDLNSLLLDNSAHLTDAEKTQIDQFITSIAAMEDKIETAENLLKEIEAIKMLDTAHLKKSDLEKLKELQNFTKEIENDYKGNLTKEQLNKYEELKKIIDSSVKEIEQKLETIQSTIETVENLIASTTEKNVNSSQSDTLAEIKKDIEDVLSLGTNYLTTAETKQLEEMKNVIETLQKKLDDVQKMLDEAKTLDSITMENMKKSDLNSLQENIEKIEKLETILTSNLTDKEKKELSDLKKDLQACVAVIENVNNLEKEASYLLAKDALTDAEKERLNKLQKDIQDLSTKGKSLFDQKLSANVDKKVEEIGNTITAPDKPTVPAKPTVPNKNNTTIKKSPATGDTGNYQLPLMLFLLSGVVLTGTIVYRKKYTIR